MADLPTTHFPVLMYHSLSDGAAGDRHADKYSVSGRQFASNLDLLSREGYTVEGCSGLLERLRNGRGVPEKYCILTVDDGHASSRRMAAMLEKKAFRATFFVTADYCRERDDFLSACDLAELREAGFDIGGHGVSHRSLKHMPEEEMVREIQESRKWLKEALGVECSAMSLPAGQGSRSVREAAFQAGYMLLCDSADKLANVTAVPAPLHRFVVLDGYGDRELSMLLSGDASYVFKRKLRRLAISLPKRILRTFDARRPE